jgi:hypothetical protein
LHLAQPIERMSAKLARSVEQVLVFDDLERGERRSRAYRALSCV